MKNFLGNVLTMNLIFLGMIVISQKYLELDTNSNRLQALGFTIFAWNFILVKCYKLRDSEKKHLIFMALFPVKLFVVGAAIYISQETLKQEDTLIWILLLISQFLIAEAFEVKTLVMNQKIHPTISK